MRIAARSSPAAGRSVEEQVADGDRGPGRPGGGAALEHRAALGAHEGRVIGGARAARQLEAAHRRDAGQRLAAEAQRVEPVEVLERADLAGGVTLERQRELVRLNALAVVGHLEELVERPLDPHLDRPCSGIERVLEQFLERRQRPLDHLAGGDARSGRGR
jgi:hypothetical protein